MYTFVFGSVCLLTDRRQGGSGQLHTCAVVQRASVGTDADWSAGAQQTQPFTFLPVAGIRHCQKERTSVLNHLLTALVLLSSLSFIESC